LNSVSPLNRSRFKHCLCVNVHNIAIRNGIRSDVRNRFSRNSPFDPPARRLIYRGRHEFALKRVDGGGRLCALTFRERVSSCEYFGCTRATRSSAHTTRRNTLALQRYNIIYGHRSYNLSLIVQMHSILNVLCISYIKYEEENALWKCAAGRRASCDEILGVYRYARRFIHIIK